MSREGGRRPMGRRGPMKGMVPGEKPKNLKATVKKLLKYMSKYKIQLFFVIVFAIGGTIFNIIGPKVLGGNYGDIQRPGQQSVRRQWHGFWENRSDPDLYAEPVSSERLVFFCSGLSDDRHFPENDIPSEERNIRKNQQNADELF